MKEPLPLETIVKPWGRIAAIHWRDGERYYMLIDKAGTVSLMPSDVVESNAESEKAGI